MVYRTGGVVNEFVLHCVAVVVILERSPRTHRPENNATYGTLNTCIFCASNKLYVH